MLAQGSWFTRRCLTVDQNASTFHVMKAQQQIDQRRLPAPERPTRPIFSPGLMVRSKSSNTPGSLANERSHVRQSASRPRFHLQVRCVSTSCTHLVGREMELIRPARYRCFRNSAGQLPLDPLRERYPQAPYQARWTTATAANPAGSFLKPKPDRTRSR